MKFYVYKWFNVDNGEVFYIGKGCNRRYLETKKRKELFLNYYKNNNCNVEIIEYFEDEDSAFKKEKQLIEEYKNIGMCFCNIYSGGKGGINLIWTDEMRENMSKNNPMKDPKQRERMSKNNPMKNKEIAKKVGLSQTKTIIYNGEETTAKEISEKYQKSIMFTL